MEILLIIVLGILGFPVVVQSIIEMLKKRNKQIPRNN
jgi:hypothetical protein